MKKLIKNNVNKYNKNDDLIIREIRKNNILKKITICIVSLVILLGFMCIYAVKNRNWIYELYGESETFKYNNSLFVYDGKTYFLTIGNFEIKNHDILKEDIESVKLMCDSRLIIGSDTFVSGIASENKGYNEMFPKEVINNLNNWYYEIKFKENDTVKTEILKVNNKEIGN